jgi:Carboxypeptidase regulatory-like domain
LALRLPSFVYLVAVLISAASFAQDSTQQPQVGFSRVSASTYSVDGVVINSATGEPVRAALVQIQGRARTSVLTGPDGKFRFEGVPQSQVTITARKPGFFSEQELSQGVAPNQIVQLGPSTPLVVVKLVPEGVIYGHVADSDGEPIENLPVKLIHAAIVNGQKTWQVLKPAQTDDQGDFRLFGLRPGTYYLKAGPSRNARPRADGNSQTEQEGYPAAFYGGPDLDSAAAITLVAGRQIRADLSLKTEVFYPVSGTIVGAPRGVPVNVQFFGQDGEAIPSDIRMVPETGAFVTSLPVGSYVIKAHAQGGDVPAGFARRPLNVNGEVAGVKLALGPTTTIPIAVRLELTRNSNPTSYPKNMQPVNIAVVSKEDKLGNQARGASVEGPREERSLAIRNLEPGTYTARIRANGPWYVESARCGESNLFTGNLIVQSGGLGQPIEIVLRDDAATLDGTVSMDGHSAQGIVLLIPEFNPLGAVTVTADSTGHFQKGELPPGKYQVFAFDRADDLEYTNPEAMRSFSSRAQFVRLSPNEQATVNLELQKRGD